MYVDLFHGILEGWPSSGEPSGDFIFSQVLTSRPSLHILLSKINMRNMICTKGFTEISQKMCDCGKPETQAVKFECNSSCKCMNSIL